MKENNLIKILVPIVAIIVVFESIVLVSNLNKGENTQIVQEDTVGVNEKAKEVVKAESVASYVLKSENEEMQVGKTYKVGLSLTPKKDLFLDGLQSYIDFDSEMVTVSKLVSSTKLPKASISEIDGENGLISSMILFNEKEGYKFSANEPIEVITFYVTPKKVGLLNLSLVTKANKDGFLTKVKSSDGVSLGFTTEKLEVQIIK